MDIYVSEGKKMYFVQINGKETEMDEDEEGEVKEGHKRVTARVE